MKILRDPDEGDTGGGSSNGEAPKWYEGSEQDTAAFIQNKGWRKPDEVIKSYRELEGMVGANTVKIPGEKASPDEWLKVYDKLGRPESPDKYEVPKFEFTEGVQVNDDLLKSGKELFHKIGVTGKQAKELLNFQFAMENERHKAKMEADAAARAKAEESLKKTLGDKFDAHVDIAKNVLRQVADPEFEEYLDESGLGNDPRLVNALVKIGKTLMEDKATGQGEGFTVNDSTAARAEIEKLNVDRDFQARYMAGDRAAVTKMEQLFKIAFPREKTT